MRTNFRWLLLTVVIIVLDQLSKLWVEARLPHYGSEPLFPFFNLVHLQNTGAAFSMFRSAPKLMFIGLASIVAIGILSWLNKHRQGETFTAVGLCLILGGAIGNVIDRMLHGSVVDFIQLHWRGAAFPSFNVADSAITVGAALLILDELLRVRRAQSGSSWHESLRRR